MGGSTMKLCKDCKWFVEPDRCAKQPNPVHGKPFAWSESWRGSAMMQRDDGWWFALIMNVCGKRGRWFKKGGKA